MPNLDCPNGGSCSECMSRYGLKIPTFGGHTTNVKLAPDKLGLMFKDSVSWGGTSLFRKNKFIGFDADRNDCG